MIIQRRWSILLVVAVVIALAPLATADAAGPRYPTRPPHAVWLPTLFAGGGTLHGHLAATPETWPPALVCVWLAHYIPTSADGQHGKLLLNTSADPWIMPPPGDGAFTFTNVPPGRYCVIVSVIPLAISPVRNEYGLAAVFTTKANMITDIGDVVIR